MMTELNISSSTRGESGQTTPPFVGYNIPLVWCIKPHTLPFVCNKLPFVTNRQIHGGFTLIELIIALVILAVLAALSAPSMSTFIKNNQQTAITNELIADILSARSEAVHLNNPVTICKTNTMTTCMVSGDSEEWEEGWFIFRDNDGDGVVDGGVDSILRIHDEPISPGITIVGTDPAAPSGKLIALTFLPSGRPQSFTGGGTFTLCDSRGTNMAKGISVSPSGRPFASKTKYGGDGLSCT